MEAAARLLARCTFPLPGAPVTCAVSGGPDSLALLVLASAAGCRVTAVHVDHGLRPGSADEAGVVRDAAARFGAHFQARRAPVQPGPNLEARARQARWSVLPPDACTGHTADDQAETVLINLLRGGGVGGLAAMRAGPRHPLLGLRRAETGALCRELGLEPVQDPMNLDPAHLRVRVRHELVAHLGELAGRDPVPVLARQAELSADAVDALDAAVADIDPADAAGLAAAPVGLARWALRRWIQTAAGWPHPPDAATLERVLEVARGRSRATEVGGGWRLARTAGRLRLEPPASV